MSSTPARPSKVPQPDLPSLVRKAGLRVTKPRIALLDALSAANGPVSIEQLHSAVGKDTCDLVTVYRCMGTFERHGVVARSYFHDGTTLFRLVKEETDRYSYHVLSKSTNQVEPLEAQASAKIKNVVQQIEKSLRDQGYTDVGHIVEFFGTRS
jgi:Fur family ferric uptake transcriptional regulator